MKFMELLFPYIAVSELTILGMVLYVLFLVKQNHRANAFLAMFIVSIVLPLPTALAMRNSMPGAQILFFTAVGATSVSGSLVFIYIRSLTGEIDRPKAADLVHLLPFPVLEGWLFLYRFVIAGPDAPKFSPWIGVAAALSLVIPTVYIAVSFVRLRRYTARVENWFSDTERMSIGWLYRITLMGLLLFVLWDADVIASIIRRTHGHSVFPLLHAALAAAVCMVTVFHVVRQPDIFSASRDMRSLDGPGEEEDESKEKYAKQSIDPGTQKRYLDRLLAHMQKDKPFLDEEITIRSLAEATNVPLHHLSIVINSMLGKNFSTLIAEYRVKHAIELLDSAGIEANILSVAFASGFSSKSSFNSAFKKITGKTPSEYRNSSAKGAA